jgi:peptide/nickel transport system permease protein
MRRRNGLQVLKKLLGNPSSLMGIVLLFAFTFVAAAAPWIAPVPETSRNPYMIPRDGFSSTPRPPGGAHPLGTTEGQYDILYGVVWGTRTAFRVGVMIALFTTLIGLSIGSIAALYGGLIDEVLMRVTEIFQAFPFLLAAITMTSVLQTIYGRRAAGPLMFVAKVMALFAFGHNPTKPVDPIQLRILTGMLAITLFGWMTYARVIRGSILSVKEQQYALAARMIGASNMRILFRHLLPNAIFPVMVIASMRIGSYVLTFAALSFLGLGAQLGYADWGQMISFARNWIPSLADHWHIVVFPGTAIVFFVLAWNLIGDILRDIFDPRMRVRGMG